MEAGRSQTWLCLVLFTCVWLIASCSSEQSSKTTTADTTASTAEKLPEGHLLPIGSHRKPEGAVEVLQEFPEPRVFYEKYVIPGKPVLFKGLAKRMPTFLDWTDEKMREKFGDIVVDVELGKKETRTKGVTSMPLSEFLDVYKKDDYYMVKSASGPMRDAFYIPKPILCGGFEQLLQDAVVWFSSGGTKSVLHSDGIDNINCIFDGTKEMVFFDKKYGSAIEQDGWNEEGSFSDIDVDKVDLIKYPGLRNIPWWKGTMEKGDCLYIPIFWYHQVNSFGSRNLAINIWFVNLLRFNESSCEGKDLPDFKPLKDFGLADVNEQLRSMILQPFQGKETVSYKDFTEALGKQAREFLDEKEGLRQVFSLIDENSDMELTWDEMLAFDVGGVAKIFPELAKFKDQLVNDLDGGNAYAGSSPEEHDEL